MRLIDAIDVDLRYASNVQRMDKITSEDSEARSLRVAEEFRHFVHRPSEKRTYSALEIGATPGSFIVPTGQWLHQYQERLKSAERLAACRIDVTEHCDWRTVSNVLLGRFGKRGDHPERRKYFAASSQSDVQRTEAGPEALRNQRHADQQSVAGKMRSLILTVTCRLSSHEELHVDSTCSQLRTRRTACSRNSPLVRPLPQVFPR